MNGLEASSEPVLRFSIFAFLLLFLFFMELASPRRKALCSKSKRWITNFGISATNTFMVSVFLPAIGIGAAVLSQHNEWGLFNFIDLSPWISIPLYLLIFDLTFYCQHRLFHSIKPLWKLHRMHHADLDYDLSTGIRFHPLSVIISSLIKLSLILILGPLAIAVLIADIVLNTTSMFNHSNWKLPTKLDAILRLIVVTPDVHRVHHSTDPSEFSCNFGFNFPWWDRIFGTYKAQPNLNHPEMKIGINELQDSKSIEYLHLLAQPFTKD